MSNRRGMLAFVHVAKARLAIDEDSWRDLVERETGKRSCAEADDAGLMRLARKLGERMPVGKRGFVERSFKPAKKPQARLAWALWRELKGLGALRNTSREAARNLFASLAGVPDGAATDPDFMTAAQLNKLIEGLKSWVDREKAKEQPDE